MDRRLRDYLPTALRDVREMAAITEGAGQPEMESAFTAYRFLLDNQFVGTLTAYGVARWETMLRIVPDPADALADRRFVILTRLNERLPYTERMLRESLGALCGSEGFTMEMRHAEYRLVVRLELTAKSALSAVASMLRRIVPANIEVDLSLLYNTHDMLSCCTHDALSAYTQDQLREEALTDG